MKYKDAEGNYHVDADVARRVDEAVRIAERYGSNDGAHHKQWVIDQMVRALLGADGYAAWVRKMNPDPEWTEWDVGVAP